MYFIIVLLTIAMMVTFNPLLNANETFETKKIYSERTDGISKFLGNPDDDTWSEVRNSAMGNQTYDDMERYEKGILAAYNSKTGDLYVISRSYFAFDTSFLDEEDIIHNVTLYLYGLGAYESRVCVVAWMDGEDGVDYDDYGLTGSINFGISDSWKIKTYNAIELNTDGLNYINKDGYTYIACREYDHDFLNVTPTGEKFAEYRNGHYFADEPGTDKDPYILITYTDTNGNEVNNNQENDKNNTPFLSVFTLILIMVIITLAERSRKKQKD